MLIKEMKYCYNDIAIVPAIRSLIEHRSQCNPYTKKSGEETLPIFTAPMSTVVNEKNFNLFKANNIIPILPRNIDIKTRIEYLKRGEWVAVGLQEFDDIFLKKDWDIRTYNNTNVLIDIANGHMAQLHDMIWKAKRKYATCLHIMAGNVANPLTYKALAEAGADYVRMSVGTGGGCLSTTQTGIHFPIASLLSETYEVKKQLELEGDNVPYIIADGGIRNYDNVVKACVLGSDYVMIGSIFSQLVESAAPTFYYYANTKLEEHIDPFEHKIVANSDGTFTVDDHGETYIINNLHKVFYGMASRKGQIDISGEKKKTSEGVEKVFKCTTNLNKWKDNMVSYLQSAMSYTNCRNIDEFNPENVDCIIMSPQTKESINK